MTRSAIRRRFSISTILQGDGDRPEFADRQRLHLLIGAHEAAQHIGIEMAIGVGDKRPGDAEHARISCERAICQLRQLPVIAWRQRRGDFSDLPFDEIVVVDQPFGSRGDRAALIDCFCNRAVGIEQNSAIVGEPAGQGIALGRSRRYRLRGRQASGVLLQAFGAEQLLAHGIAAVPQGGRSCRRSAPKDAVHKKCQFILSCARPARVEP